MIKANELRVGNIFSLHTQDGYCGDIKLKAEGILLAQNDEKFFNDTHCPYKLTEEWLIKFGFFEKFKSASNRWNIKSFELHDPCDENDKLTGRFIYDWTIYIEYVHQLQNIYFFVTGEELTLADSNSL